MNLESTQDIPQKLLLYLDWNAIISLKDGRTPQFAAAIGDAINSDSVYVYYSPTHLEEVARITGVTQEERANRVTEHLSFLKLLTNDLLLWHRIDEPRVEVRDVFDSYATFHEKMNDVPNPFEQASLIPQEWYGMLANARKEIGLSSRELNNMASSTVLAVIDDALTRYAATHNLSAKTFAEQLDFISHLMLPIVNALYKNVNIQIVDTLPLSLRVPMAYSLLDSYGFWPDSQHSRAKPGHGCDSRHVFAAALTDYLVSDDARLRQKANVVFHYFKARATAISTMEMSHILVYK